MGFLPELRGRSLYALMKFICGCSFMMYGYDAGVLGGVLLHKPFLDAIGNPTGVYIIPMISSSYSLAACVTSFFVAFVAFKIGRRGTIILGCVVAVIGSVIQSSSYSVAQLIVGRICTGFAIGCISSAVPTYLAETGIEIGDRGPANALNAIMLISGVPIAYWIDYGFTKMNNQASWRIPIVFQCIFAIISGVCMFFLPDTPRWYYARNRLEEGDAVLARLNDLPVSSPEVQQTRQEIMLAIEAELEATASLHWKQFLTMGITDRTPMKIVRRLCICFWLPMIREWMGSSLMAYYSSVILSSIGARPSLVSLLSGILNIFFALGCVPLYFTIERVGRRSVLLYGAMTMTILITVFTVLVAVPPSPSIQWASIGVIFIFLFVFGYAWQGCVWLYCSEIAPLEYRHIGGAATATGEWLMTFLTVFAGPIGLADVGWKFWIWVVSGNIVAVVFVFFLCPETGGKTLEQVDFLFTNQKLAFKSLDVGDVEEHGHGRGEGEKDENVEVEHIN
ncbi:MFS transporter [Mollisia scopiformis]|uniref:MFS transporter n=1 Tax=Mollisia scopiformis TaxID=149040 RepID=A0A194WWV8_MOLSC|nr:MFS transporter [Mollisia scopiformis]KUJ12466.1 MFS transporter [Mollisia scopiformis]